MDEYVINGLTKRRAELSGAVERLHDELRKTVNDLEVLDQTIRQFDPSFQVETIKPKAFRPPSDWSKRGEMSRVIVSILRQSAEPMSTRDIAVEMLISRALDRSDARLLKLMTKRVAVSLRDYRDKGVVRALEGPGQYNLWEIAR